MPDKKREGELLKEVHPCILVLISRLIAHGKEGEGKISMLVRMAKKFPESFKQALKKKVNLLP